MILTPDAPSVRLQQQIEQLAQTLHQLSIKECRLYLQQGRELLRGHFLDQRYPIEALVCGHSLLIDHLLQRLWQVKLTELSQPFTLIAVGGYGRGELHPYSDIDILILHHHPFNPTESAQIEQLITLLWDIGLDLGHSVRTLEECIRQAEQDVTIITNLLEARQLAGDPALFQALQAATAPTQIWSCSDFFNAKMAEQQQRHRHFNNTAYNLEPNIKEAPGGLRDIQMVGWVAKRHFGAQQLADLVEHQFLTAEEYQHLLLGERFLWRIRYALHILTHRREDRLLFDHQRALAQQFGYSSDSHHLAVEYFAKDYFRNMQELERLNEMLLQLFHENILFDRQRQQEVVITPINRRFQLRNHYLEITHPKTFESYPYALLEIFLILTQHPEVNGVRAQTIRAIRTHLPLIDESFRADLRCRTLFMEIIRQPPKTLHTVFHQMHRYGVLGRYLPEFGQITGQMQHDLFHAYTVDEHTLRLIRKLHQLSHPQYEQELPLCSALMRNLPKPELIYVAALYHDIAKGRGGDHSQLGAVDAARFCRDHYLSEFDTKLVAWLVESHLKLSLTAQRQDLSDPEVIHRFAKFVGRPDRLDYLYLLTIADIRATSATLWNSWKGALLTELYQKTMNALRRGLTDPISQQELQDERRHELRDHLQQQGESSEQIEAILNRLGSDYLLRYTPEEMVWQFSQIPLHTPTPTVAVRHHTSRGGTEIFIHAPLHNELFAQVTATLDQLGLNIVDARILASPDRYSLDTYMVLNSHGEPINPHDEQRVELTLRELLKGKFTPQPATQRRIPRRMKCFTIPTEVLLHPQPESGRILVEVISSDRSGLLSQIAAVVTENRLILHSARITTLGERVEDLFTVSRADNEPLTPAEQQQLQQAFAKALDRQLAAATTAPSPAH